MTIGLTVLAGAVLLETALIPGILEAVSKGLSD